MKPEIMPEQGDPRWFGHAMPQARRTPRLNHLYGTQRSEIDWRYSADIPFLQESAIGITANAQNTVKLTLPTPINLRLQRWPAGTQAFLFVKQFSIVPTVNTITGDIQCWLEDPMGGTIPLGDFSAISGGISKPEALMSTPLTDSTLSTLGKLFMNFIAGSASANVGFSLLCSVAYMIPTEIGYVPGVQHVE